MDRERKDELPQMQVGFIDVICLPLYRVLSETFPWVRPLYQGTLENRQHWQDLAEKVDMGLTWIDHDTIDKPVEAFTGKTHVFYILLQSFLLYASKILNIDRSCAISNPSYVHYSTCNCRVGDRSAA